MAVSLAGCEGRLSVLDPAGPAAAAIAALWWAMLAGAAAIFGLVMTLLVLAFRGRGGAEAGPGARRERIWIAGLGIGFPVVVLVGLLTCALVVGNLLLPRQEAGLVQVSAEGRQWAWSFGYADAPGRSTEGVLHIPAGRPVDVAITTADVIHSFWVPRLAGKLDAVPGHVNVLRIEAWAPGDYAGVSAEYSGPGYLEHGFTLRAHDAEGWASFLAETRP